ncbi:MAG: tetratricopeptide repeat protein, partial [Chloroflexota bacterium]
RDAQAVTLAQISEAAKVCKRLGLQDAEINGLMRAIKYQIAVSQYKAALESGKTIVKAAQEINRADLENEGRLYHGQATMRQGRYKEALRLLSKVLKNSQSMKLNFFTGRAYQLIGTTLITSNKHAKGIPYLEKALPIYQDLDLKQDMANVFNDMGIASQAQGLFEEAISFWTQGQRIFQAIGNREGNARILTNLSALNLDLGDFESAQHYGKRGLEVCREINANLGECINLLNLSLASFFLEQENESEVYCHAAIYIAQTLNNDHILANANRELGLILTHLRRMTEALEAYEYTLEIAERIDQPTLIHEARAGIAHILLQEGEGTLATQIIAPTIEALTSGFKLDGAAHPFRVYQICYLVMLLEEDSRAQELLETAYNNLQVRINRINNPEKRAYYSNILEHKQIIRAYKASPHSKPVLH